MASIPSSGPRGDSAIQAAQSKKFRVMIVDDEEDITSIFKIGLERNEFVVTTFNDPLKALAEF